MSSVSGFKKMNWLPKQSAWKEMEVARVKRRQVMNQFTANSNALAAGFQAAATRKIQGVGDLATQSAQSRMEAQLREMQAEFQKRFASVSKLV